MERLRKRDGTQGCGAADQAQRRGSEEIMASGVQETVNPYLEIGRDEAKTMHGTRMALAGESYEHIRHAWPVPKGISRMRISGSFGGGLQASPNDSGDSWEMKREECARYQLPQGVAAENMRALVCENDLTHIGGHRQKPFRRKELRAKQP